MRERQATHKYKEMNEKPLQYQRNKDKRIPSFKEPRR